MLSVILPARNAFPTLGDSLASLAAQSRRPDRVFVIDDGSTDATAELARAWEMRWSAVRLHSLPAVGIGRALNHGLRAALEEPECRWIARMDADDISHPERFRQQLALAETDDALALIGAEVSHGGGDPDSVGMRRHIDWANALYSHEELSLGLWADSPLPHPTWLAGRIVWEKVGFYDESGKIPEDYDWLHRFFACAEAEGFRAGKANGQSLLIWNESPGRLTRTSSAYSTEAFNAVKVEALARRLESRASAPDIYVFGLGPKAKTLFPALTQRLGKIRAIVDVHPRRVGIRYRDTEVWSVDAWTRCADPQRSFAIACVGTEKTREDCFRLCRAQGLAPNLGFIGL